MAIKVMHLLTCFFYATSIGLFDFLKLEKSLETVVSLLVFHYLEVATSVFDAIAIWWLKMLYWSLVLFIFVVVVSLAFNFTDMLYLVLATCCNLK